MWSPNKSSQIRAILGRRALNSLPAYWYRSEPNFGDVLSPRVLEHFLHRPVGWVPKNARGKIVSTGSLIPAVRPGDLVLGSGLHEDRAISLPKSVRVLLVRGPLTRERLGSTGIPEVYGDPASLLPAMTGLTPQTRDIVGIVPHFADKPYVSSLESQTVRLIDIQGPWRDVLQRMLECRAIVSSSLHGVIVAEAFGIPAQWFSIGQRVKGAQLKFNDYYLGTGRPLRNPSTLDAALKAALAGVLAAPDIDVRDIENAFTKALDELQ